MRLSVKDLVTQRVARSGPISFAEYMELALYSDPMGYYRRKVPGPGSDYRTSPTFSPVFGRLVARQLEKMWEALDRPASFRVTEAGAGTGDLALSVLGSCPSPLVSALTWCFVEPIPQVASLQRQTLASLETVGILGNFADPRLEPGRQGSGKPLIDNPRIQWVNGLEQLEPSDGVVLANEVLDNIPFYIFELAVAHRNPEPSAIPPGLLEIRVGWMKDRLVEIPVQVAPDSPLAESADRAARNLEPGDRFELRPAAEDWFRLAAGTLRRGYVLLIDYGDREPEIWTRRPAGTVATYKKEQLGFDPLDCPGEADITAHVNFSALSRTAAASGLPQQTLQSQRDWLRSLGLAAIERDLSESQRRAEKAADHAEALRLLAVRSRVSALAYKGGLGDLKVFMAAKDAPAAWS